MEYFSTSTPRNVRSAIEPGMPNPLLQGALRLSAARGRNSSLGDVDERIFNH